MAVVRFKQLDCSRGWALLTRIHPKQVENYPDNLKEFGRLLRKYNIKNKWYKQVLLDNRSKKIKSILKHKKD